MEWAHDLGGRTGLGAVVIEPDEPVFHAPWERVARALVYAAMMQSSNATVSGFRHAIERMEPAHYLGSPYYEHWLTAAATIAVESGVVTPQQLEQRAGGPFPLARPLAQPAVEELGTAAERFAVGDRVRVRKFETDGHTRCPSYVRGRLGVVIGRQGTFSLPDVEAHSSRRVREATYTVRFTAAELWDDGQSSVGVNVDLWDSYLEPA